jgi:hypothetical protein
LEVLIATFLITIIAFAVWNLASVYTGLLDSGFRRVETVQVVRAVMEQLRADLRHAIQDPIAGLSEGGRRTTPVRRFGLRGTATALRLDVLQPAAQWSGTAEETSRKTGELQPGGGRRLPELKTVYYRFQPPSGPGSESATPAEPALADSASPTSGLSLPGLLRWEEDFETPQGEPDASATWGSDVSRLTNRSPAAAATGKAGLPPTGEASLPDLYALLQERYGPEVLYLPEVVEFSLRYFDGQSWSTSWDSIARRALPVAIEIELQVDPARERPIQSTEPSAVEENRSSTESPGASLSPVPSQAASGSRARETFRVILEIPGSPRFQGARSARPEPPAEQAENQGLVPRRYPRRAMPPPPRPPLARPTEPVLPPAPADQWMRVSP